MKLRACIWALAVLSFACDKSPPSGAPKASATASASAAPRATTGPSAPARAGASAGGGGNAGGCLLVACDGLSPSCAREGVMCTEMYKAGDFCAEYASCAAKDGACAVVLSPKFTECKDCIGACATKDDACDKGCRAKLGHQ
jgi:hypothetical protein